LEEFATFIKLAFDKALDKWKNSYQVKSGVTFYRMTVPELIQNNILGFNLVEFMKFEALLPHITWFEDGGHQIQIRRSYELKSDKKNMDFCLKFFLNSIIMFKRDIEL